MASRPFSCYGCSAAFTIILFLLFCIFVMAVADHNGLLFGEAAKGQVAGLIFFMVRA